MTSKKKLYAIILAFILTNHVGDTIKCHTGGVTAEGKSVPGDELDCTSKEFGESFLSKCFVSEVKNSTDMLISRGCLPDRNGIESQVCENPILGNFEMKGCCCDGDLCNDATFQNNCLSASSATMTTDTDALTTTTTGAPTTTITAGLITTTLAVPTVHTSNTQLATEAKTTTIISNGTKAAPSLTPKLSTTTTKANDIIIKTTNTRANEECNGKNDSSRFSTNIILTILTVALTILKVFIN